MEQPIQTQHRSWTVTNIITRNLKKVFISRCLTPDEISFLMTISCFIEYKINKIHLIHLLTNQFYTVEQLFKYLKSFIEKGIIYSNLLNDTSIQSPLIINGSMNQDIEFYMNPELLFNGKVAKIPNDLCQKCIENDWFEANEIYFHWKVWPRDRGEKKEYGRYLDRTAYLTAKGINPEDQEIETEGKD